MLDRLDQQSPPEGRLGRGELLLRTGWIAVQIILAYCLAEEFQPFFYQAF